MYQLNPNDFKAIYEDVVIYDMKTWTGIIEHVFGKQSSRFKLNEEQQQQED